MWIDKESLRTDPPCPLGSATPDRANRADATSWLGVGTPVSNACGIRCTSSANDRCGPSLAGGRRKLRGLVTCLVACRGRLRRSGSATKSCRECRDPCNASRQSGRWLGHGLNLIEGEESRARGTCTERKEERSVGTELGNRASVRHVEAARRIKSEAVGRVEARYP